MTYLFDSKMASFIEILSFFLSGVVTSFIASWKVTLVTNALTVPGIVIIYFMIQVSLTEVFLAIVMYYLTLRVAVRQ